MTELATQDNISETTMEIRLLMEAIFAKYCYDFRDYAFASLHRRLALALPKLGCKTISALQDRVLHEPKIFSELLQYLTIPTSELFRDPTYYLALRTKVIPILKTYPSLRIWVAGCSTGEEVYSIAILLKEEGLLTRTQLYATDINPLHLEKAKEGIYRLEEIQKPSKSYLLAGGKASLSDYFVSHYDAVQLNRDLIQNVVFADHSLATDSTFAEMQFISCRNVLIYFNRELQNRAVGLFKDSLGRQCFLGIGSKESIRFSTHSSAFDVFCAEDKIYRKTGMIHAH